MTESKPRVRSRCPDRDRRRDRPAAGAGWHRGLGAHHEQRPAIDPDHARLDDAATWPRPRRPSTRRQAKLDAASADLDETEKAIEDDEARIKTLNFQIEQEGRLHRGAGREPRREPSDPRPRARELRPDDEWLRLGEGPRSRPEGDQPRDRRPVQGVHERGRRELRDGELVDLQVECADLGQQQAAGERRQADRSDQRGVRRDQRRERRVRDDPRSDVVDLRQLRAAAGPR